MCVLAPAPSKENGAASLGRGADIGEAFPAPAVASARRAAAASVRAQMRELAQDRDVFEV